VLLDVRIRAAGGSAGYEEGRKDCLDTAAGSGSKVWYTVAGGVLSDVYEPTIDNTDVSTLQYVVTDGPRSPTCRRAT
jgi:glucoamylase